MYLSPFFITANFVDTLCDRKAMLSMFVHPKYFSKKRKEMKRKKVTFSMQLGFSYLACPFGLVSSCAHTHT